MGTRQHGLALPEPVEDGPRLTFEHGVQLTDERDRTLAQLTAVLTLARARKERTR